MKLIGSLFLFFLLVGSNGCMTSNAINHAQGHPENDWWGAFDRAKDKDQAMDSTPHPACYALLPLSIPADIITLPFQAGYLLYVFIDVKC